MKDTLAQAITRDGVAISYTHTPAQPGAPRVIYLHSLALDRSLWDGVVDQLSGRADQVAMDCRGHGRSGRAGRPYSVGQFADDVADLLDHLGWPSATVVGCSMGGCVAQDFAARHPDRTDAAVFIDTTAWYGPSAGDDWAVRARDAHEKGFAALVPGQLERWFGDEFRSTRADLMSRLAAVFNANDQDSYAASCGLLGAADLRASTRRVACASVVIVGADDQATSPAMARDLVDRIQRSRLVVVPGARHLTPLENPAAVVESLLSLWTG
jgi:3-oxoadipate enol-lactonase